MRREERRNLRRTRKNHRHTFLSSFSSFFSFFFLVGWHRAETKNSRRWENMIFLMFLFFVSLVFDVFSRSEYLSLDFSPYLSRSLILTRSSSLFSLISLNYIQLNILHISRSLESPTWFTYLITYIFNQFLFFILFFSFFFNHKSRGNWSYVTVVERDHLFGNFFFLRCLFLFLASASNNITHSTP